MTIKNFIQFLCEQKEVSMSTLAAQMGISEKTLYTTLQRNDGMGMKVSTLVKWLENLDYQIVLQSFNEDDEAIIDGEDESE